MVGFGEIAICLGVLVTFIGYSVWKSAPVRVFGMALLAATVFAALLPNHWGLSALAGIAGAVIGGVLEARSPRNKINSVR